MASVTRSGRPNPACARLAWLCVFALWPLMHAVDVAAEETKPPALRVLFVGNSYIYTHDLPEVVADVAAARGVRLVPGMLAQPNFAIEDHLARNQYVAMLNQGWDWVVLQQGPSSLPENRESLRIWSGRAADLARARGIRVALMSAWPALQNAHTWLDAELSYRNAAIANGLCVLPVATAWRLSREQQPAIRLYQADQLHPEREGTLLAALVITQSLLNNRYFADPPNMAAVISTSDWRTAVSRTAALHEIARSALGSETARCFMAKTGAVKR